MKKIALFFMVLLCMSSAYAGFHVKKDGRNAIEIVEWFDYGKMVERNDRFYVKYETKNGNIYSTRMSLAEFESFKKLVKINRKKWKQKQNELDKADDRLDSKIRDASTKWMAKYMNRVVQIIDYEDLNNYVIVHVMAVGNSGKKHKIEGIVSKEAFSVLQQCVMENKIELTE